MANLSDWPTPLVEGFRTLLNGGVAVAAEGIGIRRALPHGHAAAVLGTIRAIGLDRLLGKPIDQRLVAGDRIDCQPSDLARLQARHRARSGRRYRRFEPGRLLGLGAVEESELYRALDWLGARQTAIETALARRHLKDGRWCSMTSPRPGRREGAARDGKKGKLQIVYGLLCAADGCPVAVEVFKPAPAQEGVIQSRFLKERVRRGRTQPQDAGDLWRFGRWIGR